MNISSLTKAQRIELGKIYCGSEGAYGNPQTHKALEKKGLIVGQPVVLSGNPPIRVMQYAVPFSAHYMVTQWAAEGLLDGDDND
jgi:hypothetical protein